MGHHPDHRGTDASTQKNQPDDLPKAQAPPWTPSKRNSAERESFLAEMPSEKMVTGPVLYGTQPRYLALAGTDGAMEAAMAFRIADIGNEAQLVELGERLSKALSSAQHRTDLLDFSPEYLDAAKTMLAELSGEVAALPSRTIPLTEQQVETFLDFDPVFLDIAKDILRAFIERSEGIGVMREQIT